MIDSSKHRDCLLIKQTFRTYMFRVLMSVKIDERRETVAQNVSAKIGDVSQTKMVAAGSEAVCRDVHCSVSHLLSQGPLGAGFESNVNNKSAQS